MANVLVGKIRYPKVISPVSEGPTNEIRSRMSTIWVDIYVSVGLKIIHIMSQDLGIMNDMVIKHFGTLVSVMAKESLSLYGCPIVDKKTILLADILSCQVTFTVLGVAIVTIIVKG